VLDPADVEDWLLVPPADVPDEAAELVAALVATEECALETSDEVMPTIDVLLPPNPPGVDDSDAMDDGFPLSDGLAACP
jgi:hypothetical protein